MRSRVWNRSTAAFAFGTLLIPSLWATGVERPTAAEAEQVQRYPFDPRYSQVACAAEKPRAPLPESTNPPSVVPLLAAAGSHVLSSITCTWGYLVVLKPGSEALAAQMRARFGPAVKVFIGPDPTKPTWNCWPFLESTQPPRGLNLSLHLDSLKVQSGGHFGGHLTITNRSATPFLMDTGQPLLVEVVRSGTRQIVAGYTGGVAGTGYSTRIAHGQSYQVDILGGTSRCDGSAASLRPGKYQVIAEVMDETGVPPRYLTSPVSITVTRR
jgi:hypothetical protein